MGFLIMKRFKKNGRIIKASNAIGAATTTSKDFGYIPIPGKGGVTTNYEIPERMFERKLNDMKEGISNA